MVELMEGFPDHVAAYRASGQVKKEEYEQVVMKRVNEVAARYGKINFLVCLETGMENYSLASFIDYLKISFKHFKKWNRMAIVSDQRWLRTVYEALSPLVHGEIRSYELEELETARKWVSAPLEKREVVAPPRLQAGDHLRVVAPAQSLLPKVTPDRRSRAVQRLESLGLTVSFGKHVLEIDEFKSTTVSHRIEDLHEAFADTDVKAIMAVSGGTTSNQLLQHIDYQLIKNNPKIICGLSDITALVNGIYRKTGLVTYYGPHFSSLTAKHDIAYTLDYFQRCLFSPDPFELIPAPYFYNSPFEDERLLNEGYWVINEGEAEGTLVGGNFLTLNFLQGSEFMPNEARSICFLEDNGPEGVKNVQNQLQSLINQPRFDKIRGLIIGRFKKETGMTKDLLTKIIKTKEALKDIPVIANVDFGHTSPMVTLPVGGVSRMSARSDKPAITITSH